MATAFDHTNGICVMGMSDLRLRVYNFRFQLLCERPANQRPILTIAMIPSRQQIITAGVEGIRIWQLTVWRSSDTGRQLAELVPLGEFSHTKGRWFRRVTVDEDKGVIVAAAETAVIIYDIDTFNARHVLTNLHEAAITDCVFYWQQNYLLTSSLDHTVKVWGTTPEGTLVLLHNPMSLL
jgi:WD40 repeat protein